MKHGPNPERYMRLSTPIEEEEARKNSEGFLEAVEELRDRFHLSDLIVVGCIRVKDSHEEDEETKKNRLAVEAAQAEVGLPNTLMLPIACRWGSAQTVASLGKIAYQEYTAPHVAWAKGLTVKG